MTRHSFQSSFSRYLSTATVGSWTAWIQTAWINWYADFWSHGGWAPLTDILFKVSCVGLALFWASQSTSVKKQEKVSGQGKRQIVVYTYSGILFSLIKERNSTVCAANMDEGWGLYTMWNWPQKGKCCMIPLTWDIYNSKRSKEWNSWWF